VYNPTEEALRCHQGDQSLDRNNLLLYSVYSFAGECKGKLRGSTVGGKGKANRCALQQIA